MYLIVPILVIEIHWKYSFIFFVSFFCSRRLLRQSQGCL